MAIKQKHESGCSSDDGSCSCFWLADYRPDGVSGHRHRFKVSTKEAAEDVIRDNVRKLRTIRLPSLTSTFRECAVLWLDNKRSYASYNTLSCWASHIKHLTPLYEVMVYRMTAKDVEELRADSLSAQFNARNLNAVMMTLAAILTDATLRGYGTQHEAVLAAQVKMNEGSSGVYFVRDTGSDDVKKRVASFRTSSMASFEILVTLPGPPSLESMMHELFAEQRVRGEWFRQAGELADFLDGTLTLSRAADGRLGKGTDEARVQQSRAHAREAELI